MRLYLLGAYSNFSITDVDAELRLRMQTKIKFADDNERERHRAHHVRQWFSNFRYLVIL